MRRLFLVVASLALVVAGAPAIVNADTSGGCSGATQCRTSGQGIDAAWSSTPADGPVVGHVYTDTYVAASTSMTSSRGTKTPAGGLWFSQFSYIFDGLDKPTPISESFVTDFGPDLVIAVDGKLRAAKVTGTVMVVTCTYDVTLIETCGQPQPTVVNGTWTATGPSLQVASTFRVKGPGLLMNQMFRGTQRQATATATIGGSAVPGTPQWASLSDSQVNSVSICHAPACF